VGAMCLRPMESNTGDGYRDRIAQKAPEGYDIHTHNHTHPSWEHGCITYKTVVMHYYASY